MLVPTVLLMAKHRWVKRPPLWHSHRETRETPLHSPKGPAVTSLTCREAKLGWWKLVLSLLTYGSQDGEEYGELLKGPQTVVLKGGTLRSPESKNTAAN